MTTKLAQVQTSSANFCDQVPIHILNAIQPHGVVFIVDKNHKILQVSENCQSIFNLSFSTLLNTSFRHLVADKSISTFEQALLRNEVLISPISLILNLAKQSCTCWVRILNSHVDYFVIECEPQADDPTAFLSLSPEIEVYAQRLQQVQDTKDLCEIAAQAFKSIAGYDKVMIYQFDEEWCGLVVAEVMEAGMDSYLGLKFPASDIPKQVRAFYQISRLRYIPAVNYQPVVLIPNINPITNAVTDLTHCQLRTVAPVHLEYLNNMNVQSATSFALIKENKLWGLITCHHRVAKYLRPEMRVTLMLLADNIAAQLFYVQDKSLHERKTLALAAQGKIAAWMLQEEQQQQDFSNALIKHAEILLRMAGANGAAIYLNSQLHTLGQVPDQKSILELISWLNKSLQNESMLVTEQLPQLYTAASKFEQIGCGLLALILAKETQDCVLFFKAGIVYTVKWAGNPSDALQFEQGGKRYHPRHSFKMWEEIVRGRSLPWQAYEIEAATQLRNNIIDRVYQRLLQEQAYSLEQKVKLRTRELERSNEELEQFAYISSHQLKEPLRMVSSFTQLLAKNYQDKFDNEGREFMAYIIDGATRMQELIDDVLTFSQIGKQQNNFKSTSVEAIVKNCLSTLQVSLRENNVIITYDSLPLVKADQNLLIQLFVNLLSNAIKFHAKDKVPLIHIQAELKEKHWLFSIKDNGIGIEQQYFNRIFKLFHRLHGKADYPGTGIGLAICKKIVEYHQGSIWLTSEVGLGSTFYFTLPITENNGYVAN